MTRKTIKFGLCRWYLWLSSNARCGSRGGVPVAGVLFDQEVICSYPSKGFTRPARRNPSSARRIRRPVLDHDHATRVGQKNILMIYIAIRWRSILSVYCKATESSRSCVIKGGGIGRPLRER